MIGQVLGPGVKVGSVLLTVVFSGVGLQNQAVFGLASGETYLAESWLLYRHGVCLM